MPQRGACDPTRRMTKGPTECWRPKESPEKAPRGPAQPQGDGREGRGEPAKPLNMWLAIFWNLESVLCALLSFAFGSPRLSLKGLGVCEPRHPSETI